MKKITSLLIAIIALFSAHAQDIDYTNLIINSSFEFQKEGVTNPAGTTWKPRLQDPVKEFYGWTVDFSKLGTNNSQGINQDASNKDLNSACWIGGNALLPELFEFHQTINGLSSGTYKVQCRLAVDFANKLTSQRLFANDNVQYFGKSTDYVSNLTAGEINTFASYIPADKALREMVVYTTITEGQPLKIGIRTGGLLSNGVYADGALVPMAGWFKVDYFRLTKLDIASATDATLKSVKLTSGIISPAFNPAITSYTVYLPKGTTSITPEVITNSGVTILSGTNEVDLSSGTGTSTITTKAIDGISTKTYTINYLTSDSFVNYTASIVNPSYEYTAEGVPYVAGTTWKPAVGSWMWGWSRTDFELNNTSQGINADNSNRDGNAAVWVSGDCVLPELFEHYQTVTDLPSGTYEVKCRLAVDAGGKRTTQRLFANNNVQYFGNSNEYTSNLTEGEVNTFAGYLPVANLLSDMVVYTTISAGDSIKLGIRTGGKLSDGTTAVRSNPVVGWFKADYFRLAKLDPIIASDATIKQLAFSTGTLNQIFDPAVTSYTVDLPAETSTVTPTVITNIAGIIVSGTDAVDVSLGTGTSIITTKAFDGITTLTYTINYTVIGKLAPPKTLILPTNPNIQYMGRVDFTRPDSVLFAYPNVTIKAKFEGTSLDLLMKHHNGSNFSDNNFISIIDGGAPVKFRVHAGSQVYPIAKNLTAGTHTVEIVKITESYNGQCEFLGFKVDEGKNLLTPDPLPALKLEFYGNSITCGYGIEGGDRSISDNSYQAYPAVAARELNAQFHTTSYSGIGVVMGFPTFLMGEMYNRTIALTNYTPKPANNTWDFTRYVPNVVVVALGTNDYSKGLYNGSLTTTAFIAGYKDLIAKIRVAYPNTQIVCTNSPMVTDAKLANSIINAVVDLNVAGDTKVYYFSFTSMTGGGYGGHPGLADGQQNGKELAAFIQSLVNSTSVSEIDKGNDDITIFPNPAKTNISITNLFSGSLISVIGLDAKTISVQKANNSTLNFNVTNWNKGIYLFKIQEKNSITVRKVVIN